jgi:hypothetical protein
MLECGGMGKSDLRKRIERLDALIDGMAKEVEIWRRCDDAPLTQAERNVYLRGIQDALAGAYAARTMLAKVLERLVREEKELDERLAAKRRQRT